MSTTDEEDNNMSINYAIYVKLYSGRHLLELERMIPFLTTIDQIGDRSMLIMSHIKKISLTCIISPTLLVEIDDSEFWGTVMLDSGVRYRKGLISIPLSWCMFPDIYKSRHDDFSVSKSHIKRY